MGNITNIGGGNVEDSKFWDRGLNEELFQGGGQASARQAEVGRSNIPNND
jgi:hypothetical protein